MSSHYNDKLKRHIQKTPKEGFISKSIEYYSDLRGLSGKDPTFQNARKMADVSIIIIWMLMDPPLQRSSDRLVVGDESRHKRYD